MTSPKNEGKKAHTGTKHELTTEELQLVHEIHTLAQVTYGEIVTVNPWVHPAPPLAGFESSMPWMPQEPAGVAAPWAMPAPWSV